MSGTTVRVPAWPTKRKIATVAAEIRSSWSETERKHRAELFRERLDQLVTVIEDAAE